MHIKGNIDKILSHRLADDIALLIGRVLEQFLAKVIAKRIRHEISEMPESLSEDHIAMFGKTLL